MSIRHSPCDGTVSKTHSLLSNNGNKEPNKENQMTTAKGLTIDKLSDKHLAMRAIIREIVDNVLGNDGLTDEYMEEREMSVIPIDGYNSIDNRTWLFCIKGSPNKLWGGFEIVDATYADEDEVVWGVSAHTNRGETFFRLDRGERESVLSIKCSHEIKYELRSAPNVGGVEHDSR